MVHITERGIVDNDWWRTMVPEGTKYIDPPAASAALAFWIWPSIAITSTFFVILAYLGAPFMYAVAFILPAVYGGLLWWFRRVVREVTRKKSRYLRVSYQAPKPEDADFVLVQMNGKNNLYLRFVDHVAATLYIVEHPHAYRRDDVSCWS
jgi:hypothetical protein